MTAGVYVKLIWPTGHESYVPGEIHMLPYSEKALIQDEPTGHYPVARPQPIEGYLFVECSAGDYFRAVRVEPAGQRTSE